MIKKYFKKLILKYFNLNFKKEVNGKPYKIPVIYNIGANNFSSNHDSWMIEIIQRYTQNNPDFVFIDCGMNIGQTLLKVKSIPSKCYYYGFEPNPRCFFYVQELIKKNKILDVDIYPVGLSNENTIVHLNMITEGESDTDPGATINKEFKSWITTESFFNVSVFKLDDIIKDRLPSKKTILKIDVEGAELELLEGARKTIENYQPLILLEVLPAFNAENIIRVKRSKQIFSFFENFNYQIFRIIKKQYDKNVEKFELLEKSFPIDDNLDLTDYLACHRKDVLLWKT